MAAEVLDAGASSTHNGNEARPRNCWGGSGDRNPEIGAAVKKIQKISQTIDTGGRSVL